MVKNAAQKTPFSKEAFFCTPGMIFFTGKALRQAALFHAGEGGSVLSGAADEGTFRAAQKAVPGL